MAVLQALLALGILLLAGDLLLALLAPAQEIGAGQRWPVAFVLGSGCVALSLFFLSLVAAEYALTITIILVLILAGVDLYRRGKARGWVRPVFHFPDKKGLIVVLIAIGFLIVIVTAAMSTGLGHDSITVWGIKAKIVFLEGGWPPVAAYRGWLPQLNYPLLIPSQQAYFYALMGQVDEQAVKVMFIAYFMALATFFYATVRLDYGLVLSLLFTALLVTTPQLAISGLSGYADLPLMLFILVTAVLVRRWLSSASDNDLLLAGIVAALAIWVKREGAIFWVVAFLFVLVYAFALGEQRRPKAMVRKGIIFLAPALLIAGPWLLFTNINEFPNADFNPLSLAELFANSPRLPSIFNYLIDELLSIRSWGIIWILFAIVTIWRRRDLRRPGRLFLWFYTIVPLILLSASFLFTRWNPYTRHLEFALDRLVLLAVPLAWLFVAAGSRGLNQWLAELVEKPEAVEEQVQE
jgi:hypothetical protein